MLDIQSQASSSAAGVRRRIALGARACIIIAIGALAGCSAVSAYEKCGFHGCPGDAEITAEVVAQLYQSKFVEPNAIRVQTLDHVVYLSGVVASGLEIGAAESIASAVPGVTRVMNSLAVSTSR